MVRQFRVRCSDVLLPHCWCRLATEKVGNLFKNDVTIFELGEEEVHLE